MRNASSTLQVINAGLEVEGTLKVKHAHIRFDPDNLLHASIQVSADPSSIETGIGIRDKHLRRSDYFDTNTYPEIRLQSKSFSKRGKNEFAGKFDLTIKSTTKEITIPFTEKRKAIQHIMRATSKSTGLILILAKKALHWMKLCVLA